MDLETIQRYYSAGLCRELTSREKKLIDQKMEGQLQAYKEILRFMLEYNCKVEQESVKAVELMENG